jgi:hypothetical protein
MSLDRDYVIHALVAVAHSMQQREVEVMLERLELWPQIKHFTMEERWAQLEGYLSHRYTSLGDERQSRRLLRRTFRRDPSRSNKELCANCFLPEEAGQNNLLCCARCRRIKYCSKECQRAHWKAHKKSCQSPR